MKATRILFKRVISDTKEKDVFIKNFRLPVCKKCAYYLKQDEKDDPNKISDYDKCMKYGEQNVVTGEIRFQYADYVRKQELQCGMSAKHFIPKKIE
jgi:ribosome-binding protein aMBF1 (putative translation factor)